jgi:hypothetical protein
MRFSLKTLLLTFALVGVGCTAIYYPSSDLTAVIYTATLGVLLYAICAAILQRGGGRAYWVGFAVFGGVYFLLAFYGDLQPNYRNEYTFRLITSQALSAIDHWLNLQRPQRGGSTPFTDLQITMPIGHSVLTLLVGLCGGAVARWIRRQDDSGQTGGS